MKIKAFVIQVTDSNGAKTFFARTDPTSMEPMVFYSKKIAKDFAKNSHLELPALNPLNPLSLKVKKATLKVKSKGKKLGKNDKK